MDVLGWILGIVCVLAAAVVDVWDMRISLYYPLYTTGEKTKWFRGEDGYFSLKRGVIISAIVFAAGIVPVFFFGPWALVCVFGPFALIQYFRVAKNARTQREAKQDQLDRLESRWFGMMAISTRFGFVLKPFYDIRSVKESEPEARDELLLKLKTLSDKPESEWWKRDRARSL